MIWWRSVVGEGGSQKAAWWRPIIERFSMGFVRRLVWLGWVRLGQAHGQVAVHGWGGSPWLVKVAQMSHPDSSFGQLSHLDQCHSYSKHSDFSLNQTSVPLGQLSFGLQPLRTSVSFELLPLGFGHQPCGLQSVNPDNNIKLYSRILTTIVWLWDPDHSFSSCKNLTTIVQLWEPDNNCQLWYPDKNMSNCWT